MDLAKTFKGVRRALTRKSNQNLQPAKSRTQKERKWASTNDGQATTEASVPFRTIRLVGKARKVARGANSSRPRLSKSQDSDDALMDDVMSNEDARQQSWEEESLELLPFHCMRDNTKVVKQKSRRKNGIQSVTSASIKTLKTDTSHSSSKNDGELIVDRVPSDMEDKRLLCSQQAFPFHHACALKVKSEILLELLQLHPSMAKQRDDCGNLPIHCLVDDCGSAFLPVLAQLIHQFPQGVDEQDDRGQLPLHRVCQSRKKMSIEVVRVLLEASPSSATKRVDGLLPLHITCLNDRCDPKVVDLIATRAPMAAAAATMGKTPGRFALHIACQVKSKHMANVVGILMRIAPEVAGISSLDNKEYPLHLVSASGNSATVHSILQEYPTAARICDEKGALPVNLAYLRWHFSALTGGEQEFDALESLVALLHAHPESLFHPCANGERIIDSACKKPQDTMEMLLSAAYPMSLQPCLRIVGTLPQNLQEAQLHMIPSKAVKVLKRLHPSCVDVAHDGDGYVIA